MAAANGLCCYAYMSLFQTYARIGQHLTPTQASLAFGCFGIGNILGGVPIGLVLDRTDRFRGVAILSALTAVNGLPATGRFRDCACCTVSRPARHASRRALA